MNRMKNLKYIYGLLVVLFVTSCSTDQSTFRNPAIHELENGAFVRWEVVPASSFESVDGFAISGKLLDANGNTSEYSLSVQATVSGTSLTAEDFYSVSSFPADINVTVADIASALGIEVSDINMGDFFQFYGKATRTDGTVFYATDPNYGKDRDNSNIGYTQSNLNLNASYTSAMDFNAILACPLPADLFVGTYTVTADAQNVMYGAPTFVTPVDVELTVTSVYQRTFIIDYLTGLGFDTNDEFTLDFICGGVDANSYIPFGLSCGGGLYATGDGSPSPYTDDDSSFSVSFIDNALPDCSGYSPVPITSTFTKK
jgi:hypothetical protein